MLRGKGADEQEVGWKNRVLSEDSASVSRAWGWKLSFKAFSLQQPGWFPPSLQSLSFHQLRSVQSGLNSWCLDAGTFTFGNTKKYINAFVQWVCAACSFHTRAPTPLLTVRLQLQHCSSLNVLYDLIGNAMVCSLSLSLCVCLCDYFSLPPHCKRTSGHAFPWTAEQ